MKIGTVFLVLALLWKTCLVEAAPAAGALIPIAGSPFATGNSPASVAFSPISSSNILFAGVSNTSSNNLSIYSVDQTTGTFTPVANSPFNANSPIGIAFSPTLPSLNIFATVPNYIFAPTVQTFALNPSSGNLSEVPGSPFTTGNAPLSAQFSPLASGNLFAMATSSTDNLVSVFLVDQTTGTFTEVAGSPFPNLQNPNFGVFSPIISGNLFAAISNATGSVTAYSVNQTTGNITEVPGSPFSCGTIPVHVQFSPVVSGKLFAAVVNTKSNNVSVFSVDPTTGTFSPVLGSPFSTGAAPLQIAFSPVIEGNLFAGVTNSSGSVSVFSVDLATGVFTEITGSPFTDGVGMAPQGITYSSLLAGGLFVTVTNSGDDTVSVFQVFIPIPPAPKITKISPKRGPAAGGTVVRITGENFTGTTAVKFGHKNAQSFNVISDTLIEAVSPKSKGTVHVRVTTPGGTSPVTPADLFTFLEILFPPTNLTGFQTFEEFATQTDIINVLSWDPPASGAEVAQYKIFRDNLNNLIAVVPSWALQYLDHNRHKNIVYTYYIVGVDAFGRESSPVTVSVNPL